jgi:hypothetical protein
LIVKKQFIPLRLLATSALLRHLSTNHPKFSFIENDFQKRYSGWRGEQKLAYYLKTIPQKDLHLLYNLRLCLNASTFEIDVMVVTPFSFRTQ